MTPPTMSTSGPWLGWLLFLLAAAGIFFLVKGKGRPKYLFGTWGDLASRYAVETMPSNRQITSGIIGSNRYEGSLGFQLAARGIYLQPTIHINTKPLLIPYEKFTLDSTSPIIAWGFREYVHFTVERVDVSLSKPVANQILSRTGRTPL